MNTPMLPRPIVQRTWDPTDLRIPNVERAATALRGTRLALSLLRPSGTRGLCPLEVLECELDRAELRDLGLMEALGPELTRMGRRVASLL